MPSGERAKDGRELFMKIVDQRCDIILRLYKMQSTDDYLGKSTSVMVPPRNPGRMNGTAPPGAFMPSVREHDPEAYFRTRIEGARSRGDLGALHYICHQAERHYFERYCGGWRKALDTDDPRSEGIVIREWGHASAFEVADALRVRPEWVREVRIRHEMDPETGLPGSYTELELRIIALKNEGKTYRRISEGTSIAKSTVQEFLTGKRRLPQHLSADKVGAVRGSRAA